MNEQELRRREAALREKEAELARREQQIRAGEQKQPAAPENAENAPGAAPRRPIEGLYDRIHIPLWLLDTIIVGCIIAFFVVVAVGALKGHGLL